MSTLQPFYYRQELMDQAKVSNEEAKQILNKAIEDGHSITFKGLIHGPYTNYVTYWISNGTMVQLIEEAPLHWVDLTIREY